VQALEAYELNRSLAEPPYDLNDSAEYPASNVLSFGAVNVVTDAGLPTGRWVKRNFVSKSGEDTLMLSDSITAGTIKVRIWRRARQVTFDAPNYLRCEAGAWSSRSRPMRNAHRSPFSGRKIRQERGAPSEPNGIYAQK
jgi:hypothetical protein